MALTLAQGTIEEIKVEVIDNSDTPETDLSAHSPKYDVVGPGGAMYTDEAVTAVSNMFLYCLIDTTILTFPADLGKYQLWVKFTLTPETPKLGPIVFYIQ